MDTKKPYVQPTFEKRQQLADVTQGDMQIVTGRIVTWHIRVESMNTKKAYSRPTFEKLEKLSDVTRCAIALVTGGVIPLEEQ